MLLTTLLSLAFISGVPAPGIPQSVGGTGKVLTSPSCSGVLLNSDTMAPGGSWALYYSSANGGTNCLVVRNRSGKPQQFDVGIRSGTNYANDDGWYSSFAAVSISGTKGKCISYHVGYAFTHWGDDNVHCK